MIYYVFITRKFPISMGPVLSIFGDMFFSLILENTLLSTALTSLGVILNATQP
jgi:hypothetical protein